MSDTDLRYALEKTREAMERLDQALSGYPVVELTEHDGRGAIRSAYLAAEAAAEAVEHDIGLECERMEDAMEACRDRVDPELRWEDDRIERAEEQRAREAASE